MIECNDKAWFSDHIRQMKQTMFRVAFVILGNEADCEDATGNAILTAYEKLPQLRDRELFRAWFIRILKNECYRVLKRRKRAVHLDEEMLLGYEMRIPDPDLHRAIM
jgi:RNA polymerase sigma-70 factor (ECF subfamily)